MADEEEDGCSIVTNHRRLPMPIIVRVGGQHERPCHTCFGPGPHATCGRCRQVQYCGTICQATDWRRGHRHTCSPPAADTNWYTAGCTSVLRFSMNPEVFFAAARAGWRRITASTLSNAERLVVQEKLVSVLCTRLRERYDWEFDRMCGEDLLTDELPEHAAILKALMHDTLSRYAQSSSIDLDAACSVWCPHPQLGASITRAAALSEQDRWAEAETVCRATMACAVNADLPSRSGRHKLLLACANILATALMHQRKFHAAQSVLALANERAGITATEGDARWVLDNMRFADATISPGKGDFGAAVQCSFLECVPEDLMLAILQRLDLRALCRLAGCSKLTQRLVYAQAERLWRRIDLGSWPHHPGEGASNYLARLTDEALATILRRCNAHGVTTYISLRHCTGLSGAGLAPLRSSRVLQEIDLRTEDRHLYRPGPASLNNVAVVDVLRTLLHLPTANLHSLGVLSVVHAGRQRFGVKGVHAFSPPMRDLMDELTRATLVHVADTKAACWHCKHLIAGPDTNLQVISQMPRAALSPCGSCKRYSCQNANAGTDCLHYTDECVRRGNIQCSDCSELDACAVCEGIVCEVNAVCVDQCPARACATA